jgi:S-disulfanyl-L-cysteine oxidoreductase SoxD
MLIANLRSPAGILAAAAILGACSSAPATPPQNTPNAAAPAAATALSYTEAQATRGQQVFTTVCGACHSEREFSGQAFMTKWKGKPVGDFHGFISTNMPQDRPGALPPQQYIDVIAYILKLNGNPAGSRELPGTAAGLSRLNF